MGKTVLITGASRGIGRAAAILFASQGWNVVVNYLHSKQAAEEIAAAFPGRAAAVGADVGVRAQVERMVETAVSLFGGVDALVNNAGIAQQKLFTDLTDDDWSRMMSVCLTGAFHCCQAVLPGMIHRKSGAIVNVSSMWGVTGGSCEVHYSSAKAGLIGLTKALAKELGPSGIRVNCVAPGVVDTDMLAGFDEASRDALKEETPLMRLGTPGDIAKTVAFLAGDDASFITGQVVGVNGGFVI